MDIARLYRDAQAGFVDLVADLSPDEWRTPVPCTPGWTVRDVLSHVAGVTDDVLVQRLDGVATEPWTRAQVDRWRDTDAASLLDQWNEQIGPVADALAAFEQPLPMFDCHMHEHDVRHALGRPGRRDSELIALMAARMNGASVGRPVSIDLVDADPIELPGEGEPVRLSGVTRFELVRARLGRRSRAQFLALDWSAPLTDEEVARWFAFGPSDDAIDE